MIFKRARSRLGQRGVFAAIAVSLLVFAFMEKRLVRCAEEEAMTTTGYRCSNVEGRELFTDIFTRGEKQNDTSKKRRNKIVRVGDVTSFFHKCGGGGGGLQSSNEFSDEIENEIQIRSVFLDSARQVIREASNFNNNNNLTVFIYDFSLTSDDVYIDLESDSLDSEHRPLIIVLVARQFVTFNLYILHKSDETKARKKGTIRHVTVILSGSSALQIIQHGSNTNSGENVHVLHAPPYYHHNDQIEKTNINNDHDRHEWLRFLHRNYARLVMSASAQFDFYIEHLTMLCHIKNLKLVVRQDQQSFYKINAFPLVQFTEYDFDRDHDFLIMKKCRLKDRKNKTSHVYLLNVSTAIMLEFDYPTNQLLELRENMRNRSFMKLFVKDCGYSNSNNSYNIILLYTASTAAEETTPSFLVDTSRCPGLNIIHVSK
jgi:hypothetical protein